MSRTPERYCKHFCRYLGDQLHLLQGSTNHGEIPETMCPLVAKLAVRSIAQDVANTEADSYVPTSQEPVTKRDELLAGAGAIAEGYGELIDRCVRKLVDQGSENSSLDAVRTITSQEVISSVANISRQLSES